MPKLGYQRGLDGLRAIAVLAVVAHHYTMDLAPGGWLGVNLFFVISGYLITRLLLEEHEHGGTIALRAFYRRRAARLIPAVVVVTGVTLIGVALFHRSALPDDARGALTGLLYVSNIAQMLESGRAGTFAPLWSLSLEEQFYLLWPLALLLALRRSTVVAMRTAMVSAAIMFGLSIWSTLAAGWAVIYFGAQGAVCLLVGCAGAFYTGERLRRLWLLPALVSPFALLRASSHEDRMYVAMPFIALTMLAVVYAALDGGPLARLGALSWLGKRSYGLYLVHMPVLLLASQAATFYPHGRQLALLALPCSIAVADALYRFVEQPLRKRLSDPRAEIDLRERPSERAHRHAAA